MASAGFDTSAVLIECSRALARGDALEPTLRRMLDAIAGTYDIGPAAIVVQDGGSESLGIVASIGLDAVAAAGLTEAMSRPGHPIAQTFESPIATYDVTPMNPGGPALRSHLPLFVRRDGADRVVGVLALAYDRPIEYDARPVLEAVADLAGVAVSLRREPATPSG